MGGTRILGRGIDGVAGPATPWSLAEMHSLWAADIQAFGPWREDGEDFLSDRGGSGDGVGAETVVTGQATSSLDAAWALDRQSRLPAWSTVLAPSQSTGRGQLRRHWQSPPGNVYAALVLPDLERLSDLSSLLVGALLVLGLRELGLPVELKWPNDILLPVAGRTEGSGETGGTWRKVGGVLVEERGDRCLAGIGLNAALAPDEASMREGRAVPAGTLAMAGSGLGPLALWSSLVHFCQNGYRSCFQGCDPGSAVRRIEPLLAWRGMRVEVAEREPLTGGVVVGLADDGGLRLMDRTGEQLLYSGSILPY